MIRQAKHQDIPALMAMLGEMYAASKYVGRGEIAPKAAESLFMGAIASQGQFGPQGSHVAIAEEEEPVGFLVGVLDRVYHVGSKLMAQDVLFYVRPGASPRHALALVDSYIAWAARPRACIEIMLSWSDAIPGAEKIAALAKRKGFDKVGEMFELRLDAAERAAA